MYRTTRFFFVLRANGKKGKMERGRNERMRVCGIERCGERRTDKQGK
jgi:hypothetical protein